MMNRLRTLLSITVLLLLIPAIAGAQTSAAAPRWALGIAVGRTEDTGKGSLFSATRTAGSQSGMTLDISGRTAGRLGLVAEAGLFDAVSLLGGARWTIPRGVKVRLFGQVLGGPAVLTPEATALAIQAGAGVELLPSSRVGFRLQADYRTMAHNGDRSHQLRALVGIVFSSRD